MTWGDELVKLRRFLRDPNGTIWTEALLRNLWNDVQQDLQHKTGILEGATAQRVPAIYQMSYQFDWEYHFLPEGQSLFYQCLGQHDEGVFCHRWEPQEVTGIDADVADYGAHFTHAWEAFSDTPGEVLRMAFPRNFNTMKFIAYNEEPIEASTQKYVQSNDPSHITKEGDPICYYPVDESSNCYVLYPRPSVSFVNEIDAEGVAMFAQDDTEDLNTGIIAVRSGSFDDGLGVSVDVIDVADNVFMVYTVSPTDVVSLLDEPECPLFLRKYIRFGVIARAYGANTDGRIKSLADFWGTRYGMGVKMLRDYVRKKKHDRDYRMTTKGVMPRRSYRHPRLPDGYPAV